MIVPRETKEKFMSTRFQRLTYSWSLPDRTEERTQISLRLTYDLYSKLHALKVIYPGRSVNDIICDLLTASIDEVVESLPERVYTSNDMRDDLESGFPEEALPSIGQSVGLAVNFRRAYCRLLESKEKETSANE